MAQELIHSMGKKNKKPKLFGLKADMSKAYNMVELPFLLQALRLFGLSEGFTSLSKVCTCTSSIGVNINGEVDGYFYP